MWFKVTLGAVLVAALASEAAAQCRVEGVVTSANGTPVAGATVVLDLDNRKATTDEQGRYSFADVKAGSRVRVSAQRDGREFAWEYSLVTRWVERLDLRERPPMPAALSRAIGTISGVVRTASGGPLPSASVDIDDPARHALTDQYGRYVLTGVPAGGNVSIVARAAGMQDATREAVVDAGSAAVLDFALARGAAAPAPAAENQKPPAATFVERGTQGETLVRPAEVDGLPGLVRQDVVRAVQLLPGVEATQEASTGLWVRGGTPDQQLVTLDGITLYNADALLGLQSAVDPGSVRMAAFRNSNTSAADGGRLTGGLRLAGDAAVGGKTAGYVDVDMLGFGGKLALPLGSRASAVVAARTSYPGDLYDSMLDLSAIGGATASRGQAVAYSGGVLRDASPSLFRDVVGRFDVDAGKSDAVSITVAAATSTVDASREVSVTSSTIDALANGGVDLPEGSVSRSADVADWSSFGISGRWARQWSASTSTEVTVAQSTYSDARDRSFTLADPATGRDYSMAAGRGGNAASSDATDITDTALRAESRVTVGFAHALRFGGELVSLDVSYRTDVEYLKSRNADGSFQAALARAIDRASTSHLTTLFVEDGWRPNLRAMLTPGVRLTYDDATAAWYAEPRLSGSYQVSRVVMLKGGLGMDHQFLNRVVREDLLHGDSAFWTLADGTVVPVARSQHAFAGARFEGPRVAVDIEAYYRGLDRVAIYAPRTIPGDRPADVAHAMHVGAGTASGVEMALRHRLASNALWISYTASRVEYNVPTLEPAVFPGSQDQQHQLKAADIYRAASGWTLGASWVFSSGRPTTPVENVGLAWLPVGAAVALPAFGAKNSSRLPAYHRLDLSAQRQFQFGGVRTIFGASMLNVYNRANVSFDEYQGYGQTPVITDVSLLGRVLNLFARVAF